MRSNEGHKPGFRGALAFRDFRLLLASLTTSGIGDWFYNIALIVFILEQTDSAAWVAAATIARLSPYALFGTIGGALADRYDRRKVMILSDLARAVLMFLLTAVAVTSAPVILAIVLIFLATTAGTPFYPAVAASTPAVVDERHLAPANGLITTIDSLAIAVGPALGGLALAFGPPAVAFFVNALTFIASAALLSRLHLSKRVISSTDERGSLRQQLRDGVRAIRASPGVGVLIALAVAASFTYGQESVLYPLVSRDLLGTGEAGVSLLFAAAGVGGVLGATFTNRAAERPRAASIIIVASFVAATPLLVLPFTSLAPFAYLLLGIEGASFIFVDVLGTTIMQRALPSEVTARVFGILDSVALAGTVVGAFLAPILVDAISLEGALITAGITFVACVAVCIPRLRAMDKRSEARRAELAPRVETLEGLDIFSGLGRLALEALAAVTIEEGAGPGTAVVRQGETADDFFVATSGHLEVLSRGEAGGTARRVNEIRAGDYFGEIGLLERIPRTATVRAITASRFLRIPGQAFLDAVGQAPASRSALRAGMMASLARTHPSYRPTSVEEATK
jgi:predicted MFS family arabinose efflux permease